MITTKFNSSIIKYFRKFINLTSSVVRFFKEGSGSWEVEDSMIAEKQVGKRVCKQVGKQVCKQGGKRVCKQVGKQVCKQGGKIVILAFSFFQ